MNVCSYHVWLFHFGVYESDIISSDTVSQQLTCYLPANGVNLLHQQARLIVCRFDGRHFGLSWQENNMQNCRALTLQHLLFIINAATGGRYDQTCFWCTVNERLPSLVINCLLGEINSFEGFTTLQKVQNPAPGKYSINHTTPSSHTGMRALTHCEDLKTNKYMKPTVPSLILPPDWDASHSKRNLINLGKATKPGN